MLANTLVLTSAGSRLATDALTLGSPMPKMKFLVIGTGTAFQDESEIQALETMPEPWSAKIALGGVKRFPNDMGAEILAHIPKDLALPPGKKITNIGIELEDGTLHSACPYYPQSGGQPKPAGIAYTISVLLVHHNNETGVLNNINYAPYDSETMADTVVDRAMDQLPVATTEQKGLMGAADKQFVNNLRVPLSLQEIVKIPENEGALTSAEGLLMSWQTFKNPVDNSVIFEGYASSNIGRIVPDTQSVVRAGHIKSGQIINKSDYPALEAWAIHHKLLKPVADWKPETLYWGDDNEQLQSPLLTEFIRFADSSHPFAESQKASRIATPGGNGAHPFANETDYYVPHVDLDSNDLSNHLENFFGIGVKAGSGTTIYTVPTQTHATGVPGGIFSIGIGSTRSANTAFLASIVAY